MEAGAASGSEPALAQQPGSQRVPLQPLSAPVAGEQGLGDEPPGQSAIQFASPPAASHDPVAAQWAVPDTVLPSAPPADLHWSAQLDPALHSTGSSDMHRAGPSRSCPGSSCPAKPAGDVAVQAWPGMPLGCTPSGEGGALGEQLLLSARCSSDPGCGATFSPRAGSASAAGHRAAGSWHAQDVGPDAERASGAAAQQAAALAGWAEGAAWGEPPGGWRLPQANAAAAAGSGSGGALCLHAQPSGQAELSRGAGEVPGVADVLGAAAEDFDVPVEAAQGAPPLAAKCHAEVCRLYRLCMQSVRASPSYACVPGPILLDDSILRRALFQPKKPPCLYPGHSASLRQMWCARLL